MDKCSHCGCELTEDNCSYEDFTCDDCYEDEQDEVEDDDDLPLASRSSHYS